MDDRSFPAKNALSDTIDSKAFGEGSWINWGGQLYFAVNDLFIAANSYQEAKRIFAMKALW